MRGLRISERLIIKIPDIEKKFFELIINKFSPIMEVKRQNKYKILLGNIIIKTTRFIEIHIYTTLF